MSIICKDLKHLMVATCGPFSLFTWEMLLGPGTHVACIRVESTLGLFFFFSFFVDTVEARMRANAQNVQQGEQETRGAGEGSKTQWGTETWDLWKGEGWGQGTHGKQDGHYRDFQVLTRRR